MVFGYTLSAVIKVLVTPIPIIERIGIEVLAVDGYTYILNRGADIGTKITKRVIISQIPQEITAAQEPPRILFPY